MNWHLAITFDRETWWIVASFDHKPTWYECDIAGQQRQRTQQEIDDGVSGYQSLERKIVHQSELAQ